jgi:hypothetical protein
MLDAYTKEPYYAIKNLKIPVLYYRSFAEQEHELARHRDCGSGLPNKRIMVCLVLKGAFSCSLGVRAALTVV